MLEFNHENSFISDMEINFYQKQVEKDHNQLKDKTGLGNDFLGWHNWPYTYNKEEFEDIINTAKEIREKCDVFLVCGIGGSYLGSRAAIEMINGLYNQNKPEIIYIGNTLSSNYITQVLNYIKDKEVICNVISKSGTTTETALAFRLVQQFLKNKYGEKANEYIYATTDAANGTLKKLSIKNNYKTFTIPNDIGGRFSVNTAVGLLPIAVAGIDIRKLMEGCQKAHNDLNTPYIDQNPAYKYAVCRHILENKGKTAEVLVSYEPQMLMFQEWWKQLFGESEGKNRKGLLPCSVNYTADLHSLGQFIQDGKKCLFETIIKVENPQEDLIFPEDEDNDDNMNYLSNKSISWINQMACQGTTKAHVEEGNVPNLEIIIPNMSEYIFGYLIYFFFKAISMSTYLKGENPFNQPGVEIYKQNMFNLLGKPTK